MSRPPSIQWYYKQYLGDNKVLAMDWDTRGMHVHLLMLSIQEEPPGTIPADDAAIRRWLSLPVGSVDSDLTWRRVKPQLLAAWQPEGDRLVNTGMKAACERRDTYLSRYGTKTVRKQNEKIAESYESEDVVVEVGFDLESFDPEKSVREIQAAHPRPETSQANESAIIDAIEYVAKKRSCKRQEAAEWLLARTELYRVKTDAWGSAERQFITKATRWFSERQFEESETYWERKNGGDPNGAGTRTEARRKSIAAAAKNAWGDSFGQDAGSVPSDSGANGKPSLVGRPAGTPRGSRREED